MKEIKVKPLEKNLVKFLSRKEHLGAQFLKLFAKKDSKLLEKKYKRGEISRSKYQDGEFTHNDFEFKRVVIFSDAEKKLKIREGLAELGYAYSSSVSRRIIQNARTSASSLAFDFWHLRIGTKTLKAIKEPIFFVKADDDSGRGFFFDSDFEYFNLNTEQGRQNRKLQADSWNERGIELKNTGRFLVTRGDVLVENSIEVKKEVEEKEKQKEVNVNGQNNSSKNQ